MTTQSVEAIVGKLTPVEKAAIVACRWSETSEPISYDAHANGEYCCPRHATMTGLAIRAHLLETGAAPAVSDAGERG
jgi:hypothetical protein